MTENKYMENKKVPLDKKELSKIFKLYGRQSWLLQKDQKVFDLLSICETETQKTLIYELLGEFYFLDQKTLDAYLNAIANFIIEDSGFVEETTQVSAITYDDEADSSQKILDYIKMPLFKMGWSDIKTVNRYGSVIKNYTDGLTQILFIDEFVGSGSTILNRVKQLKSDIKEPFDLKFCFIAGMEHGLNRIEALGYEVFCPLRLKKGISEFYQGETLDTRLVDMILLEKKLAKKITTFDLSKYSLGYNQAEALYSLEGNQGNTPNSVFPLFWWPRDNTGKKRSTLLTRFEKGLK